MSLKIGLYVSLCLSLACTTAFSQNINGIEQFQQRMLQQLQQSQPRSQAPKRAQPQVPQSSMPGIQDFEIIALVNYTNPSVQRTLDGKINIKDRTIQVGFAGMWTQFTIDLATTVLRHLNIQTSTLPNGHEGALADYKHLRELIAAAFKYKNPGIVAELNSEGPQTLDAPIVFVPKTFLNASNDPAQRRSRTNDLRQRIEAGAFGILGTITLSDIASASAAQVAEVKKDQSTKSASQNRIASATGVDLERYSAVSVAGIGIMPRICATNEQIDFPEKSGILGEAKFLDWVGQRIGSTRRKISDRFDALLNNVDEVYSAMLGEKSSSRDRCSVFIGKVSDLRKIVQGFNRDKVSFLAYEIFVDAQDARLLYAKRLGFETLWDFNFGNSLEPKVSAANVALLKQRGLTSPEDVAAALARLKASHYSGGTSIQDIIQFVGDEQQAARSGKTAADVRGEVLVAAKKAEDDRLAALAEEFPYQAIITCGNSQLSVLACFSGRGGVDTELELRNGSSYGLYKIYQINDLGTREREGLVVNLRKTFELKLQNANDMLVLNVRIVETRTRQEVFTKSAGTFGVIRVGNGL